MKSRLDQSTLDHLVAGVTTKKNIFGAVFHVTSETRDLDLVSAAGEMSANDPYYIASINKIFVSAVILNLWTEGKLGLQDKLSVFLPQELLTGLHRYKGRDYSNDLTIQHLLSQTSGLPCYLVDKQADGSVGMKALEAGLDQPWPIEKVIQTVKQMQPHFPPGQKGRAHYIDTNHQILGLVIEKITGQPVNKVLNNLFNDLKLSETFVCEQVRSDQFAPLYYKSSMIHIIQFLNSTQNDIVSTTRDQMTFLKAFFNGYFFPREKLPELEQWNNIFSPFQYGIGIQKFYIPRLLSPFQAVPDMIGHCGSTGSVAFYVPEMDLYLTGTINQQASPNIAFQTLIKIIQHI